MTNRKSAAWIHGWPGSLPMIGLIVAAMVMLIANVFSPRQAAAPRLPSMPAARTAPQFSDVYESAGVITRLLPKKFEICVRPDHRRRVYCGLKLDAYGGMVRPGYPFDFTYARQHLENGQNKSIIILNYLIVHG